MKIYFNNKILLFFSLILCFISLSLLIEPNHNGIFIVNITAHKDVIVEPTCSSAKPCYDGVLLPAWRPLEIPECTRWFRAFVYLLALGYLFFGVSIVADRFMAAIEVITSQEKVVKLRKPNGEEYTVLVRVWNETVSNLTLMALGSSAPEILLSVIEIFGNNFEAGELGPGTIVGSAAFNLFVIVAICIYVIPPPEIRRIYRYDVFWVTVIWSSFAYVWLYLILAVFSPNVVEVWEGVLTFLFFPLTVMSAYFANLYTHNFGQRILANPMVSFVRRRAPNRSPDKDKNDVTLEKGENLNAALMGNRGPKEEVAFDTHKKRYLDIFRQLRTENPDMTIDELEILATDQIVKEAPKSRAFYRIQATHKMMGAGDLMLKSEKQLLRKKSNQSQNSYMPEKPKVITVQFDPVNYMCLENVGTIKLTVKCDRGSIEVPTRVSVHYKTVADTAQEDDDFIPVEGDLIFKPGETVKHIEVGIIDNDVYEEDEQFHVRLSNIKAVCDTNEQQTIKAELGLNSLATVLIIDDDHGGAFTFNSEYFKVPENQGVFILEVTRHRGARGKVTIPYRTIDGAAKNGEDYVGHDGELVFEDGQTKALIEIEIINDDEYEKSEDFYVELSPPVWLTDYGLGEGGADGRPVLGSHTRCRIDIIEDVEFKGFVDRLVANANVSLMVGTHSWRQQFRDAFKVEDLDDDGDISGKEKFLHYVSFPWKLIFALIPPTDYFSGWLSFCVSIFAIGVVTAVIGDVASHLGCTIGLKDSITAITLVALGTSLPDTFASKTAALQDKTADASIGNVTGSNAVNVFLGIGIGWAIAAIYHAWNGTVFRVEAGTLASSVTLFLLGSVICFGVLVWRRYNPSVMSELGGPTRQKHISVAIFLIVWFVYVVYSICVAYCILPGF